MIACSRWQHIIINSENRVAVLDCRLAFSEGSIVMLPFAVRNGPTLCFVANLELAYLKNLPRSPEFKIDSSNLRVASSLARRHLEPIALYYVNNDSLRKAL